MRRLPLLCAILLSACSKLPLDLPATEAANVVILEPSHTPGNFVLAPNSPKHQRLREWLAGNQYGWAEYLATEPAVGVVISTSNGRLHFTGNLALACPGQSACLQKAIEPSAYAFLLEP